MIGEHKLVFNNKIFLEGIRVLNSAGIKSALEFYRELLVRSLVPETLSQNPFKFCLHGGIVCYHFEPGTDENELLQLALQKCVHVSAEMTLISPDLIVIKLLFYEKGEKEWYAEFQVDFDVGTGELHETSAGVNVANKTGFD